MISIIKKKAFIVIVFAFSLCILFTLYQMLYLVNGFDIFTAILRIGLFVLITKLLYDYQKKGENMKFKSKENQEEQLQEVEEQTLIVPKLTTGMNEFLQGKDISTYKDKLQVIAEFKQSVSKENISDEDYKAFFGAILLGQWELKGFLINVGKPIGKTMYLNDTGTGLDFVKYVEQATKFDEEKVKNILPIYQNEAFREEMK